MVKPGSYGGNQFSDVGELAAEVITKPRLRYPKLGIGAQDEGMYERRGPARLDC